MTSEPYNISIHHARKPLVVQELLGCGSISRVKIHNLIEESNRLYAHMSNKCSYVFRPTSSLSNKALNSIKVVYSGIVRKLSEFIEERSKIKHFKE